MNIWDFFPKCLNTSVNIFCKSTILNSSSLSSLINWLFERNIVKLTVIFPTVTQLSPNHKWKFTRNTQSLGFLFYSKEGQGKTGTGCALDCGAGIGRITKRLLLPLFHTVDLVDVTQEFLDKARNYLSEEAKRVENYFCCGLQDFQPQPERYDVIWIQWVIGKAYNSLLSLQYLWTEMVKITKCIFYYMLQTQIAPCL